MRQSAPRPEVQRPRTWPRAARWLLLFVLGATGCGYQFAAAGTAFPATAKTVYVEHFGNRTRITGINDEFMRYLKDEIADHKRLALVDSPGDADLVMGGEIVYMNTVPAGFNAATEPTLYNESIVADATLTDTHTHAVLWNGRGVNGNGQFPTVAGTVITTSPYFLQQNMRSQDIANLTDIQVAQTQRSATNDLMMQQLAQNLYDSMAQGF